MIYRVNKTVEIKEYTPGLNYKSREAQRKLRGNIYQLINKGIYILPTCGMLVGKLLYIPIIDKGKIGFIDCQGNIVCIPKYDDIKGEFFSQSNILAVKLKQKWSAINSNFTELLPFDFYCIWPSKDSSLVTVEMSIDGKYQWSVIDVQSKNTIVPYKRYSLIEGFRFGYARVKKDGLYGVINEKGEEIIPTKYSELLEFYDNWDKPETKVKLNSNDNWSSVIRLNDFDLTKQLLF